MPVRRRQLRGFVNTNDNDNTSESNVSTEDDEDSSDPPKLSVWARFWGRMAFAKYVIIVLIIPPVLNFGALKRESVALVPTQGELIDVGWGQKMFIKCQGDGSPTVMLEAPTGGTSDLWYLVQEQLSSISKVCVYDRSGLGFSSLPVVTKMDKKDDNTRRIISQVATLEQMTQDLHYLITEAKPLEYPFIIVGSETGALIARHYTLMHPGDVSDVVLINPMVEDLFTRQKDDWNKYWHSHVLPSLQSLHLAAFVGLSRLAVLVGWLKADIVGEEVPQEVEYRQLYHLCNPEHMNAVFYEHLLLNTSFLQMSEVQQVKVFPKHVSVTVINNREFDKIPSHLYEAWEQSQIHLRQSLHPNCSHLVHNGTVRNLYNEPKTIVGVVKNLVYRWRIANNVLPTFQNAPDSFPE